MEKLKEFHLDAGITPGKPAATPQTRVQLFGHVTLIQSYGTSYPGFTGSYALVALRDTPGKRVAIVMSDTKLQTLVETALATGNLVYFTGYKLINPSTPGGGAWSVDVYKTDNICLYNIV